MFLIEGLQLSPESSRFFPKSGIPLFYRFFLLLPGHQEKHGSQNRQHQRRDQRFLHIVHLCPVHRIKNQIILQDLSILVGCSGCLRLRIQPDIGSVLYTLSGDDHLDSLSHRLLCKVHTPETLGTQSLQIIGSAGQKLPGLRVIGPDINPAIRIDALVIRRKIKRKLA